MKAYRVSRRRIGSISWEHDDWEHDWGVRSGARWGARGINATAPRGSIKPSARSGRRGFRRDVTSWRRERASKEWSDECCEMCDTCALGSSAMAPSPHVRARFGCFLRARSNRQDVTSLREPRRPLRALGLIEPLGAVALMPRAPHRAPKTPENQRDRTLSWRPWGLGVGALSPSSGCWCRMLQPRASAARITEPPETVARSEGGTPTPCANVRAID